MKHEMNFWVVGGDMRQAKLAQLLAEDGHTVHTYALDPGPEVIHGLIQEENLNQAGRADCVVLPLTVSTGGGLLNAPLSLSEHPLPPILDRLSPRQFLCGGRVDPETQSLADQRGLTLYDYFAREELAVANAVPTAEGAIQLAMEHLPITVHGARVLIVGFGRVGRITAQRFAALGAKVSVAARKYDQLAWAQAMGFGAEELAHLTGWLCGYDLIVNTVPSRVLNRSELEDLKPDCLIIDLASKPGGDGVPFGSVVSPLPVRFSLHTNRALCRTGTGLCSYRLTFWFMPAYLAGFSQKAIRIWAVSARVAVPWGARVAAVLPLISP